MANEERVKKKYIDVIREKKVARTHEIDSRKG